MELFHPPIYNRGGVPSTQLRQLPLLQLLTEDGCAGSKVPLHQRDTFSFFERSPSSGEGGRVFSCLDIDLTNSHHLVSADEWSWAFFLFLLDPKNQWKNEGFRPSKYGSEPLKMKGPRGFPWLKIPNFESCFRRSTRRFAGWVGLSQSLSPPRFSPPSPHAAGSTIS